MTAALFYVILNALAVPIDLAQFCLVFPAIMGAVTCLIIYFVGRDVGGEAVGLFSAFFLALNSSYISRTAIGFYDTETVGILGIMLYILFFLRSIEEERPLKVGVIYAVAAGLSLALRLRPALDEEVYAPTYAKLRLMFCPGSTDIRSRSPPGSKLLEGCIDPSRLRSLPVDVRFRVESSCEDSENAGYGGPHIHHFDRGCLYGPLGFRICKYARRQVSVSA